METPTCLIQEKLLEAADVLPVAAGGNVRTRYFLLFAFQAALLKRFALSGSHGQFDFTVFQTHTGCNKKCLLQLYYGQISLIPQFGP